MVFDNRPWHIVPGSGANPACAMGYRGPALRNETGCAGQ